MGSTQCAVPRGRCSSDSVVGGRLLSALFASFGKRVTLPTLHTTPPKRPFLLHPRCPPCPLHQAIAVFLAAHCPPHAQSHNPSTRQPPPPALFSTSSTPSAARIKATRPPTSLFSKRTKRTPMAPRLQGVKISTSRRRPSPRQTPRPHARILRPSSALPGAPSSRVYSDPTFARTIAYRMSQSPTARSPGAS